MSELKNTPWKYELDYDGTCEIFATAKTRESGLKWIASAIDESTAKAIASLPETLAELERLKAENARLKKESYELKQVAKKVEEAWINWDEDGSRQMQEAIDEMEEHLT